MSTEKDNVNAGAIGMLVALLTVAVLGVALALTALVRDETYTDTIKKEAVGPYVELRKQHQEELTGPAAWVDKEKGTVSVPVSRAMEVVVQNLKDNPQSATPLAPAKPDAGVDAAATDTDAGAATADGGTGTEGAEAGAPAPEAPAPEAPAPQTPPAPKAPAPKAPAPKAPGGAAPPPPPAPPGDAP